MTSAPGRTNAPDRPQRRFGVEWWLAAVVLLLAALAWRPVLEQAEQTIFARVPLLDEVYYLDRAAEIRTSDRASDEPYFMSPLYPRLIAATGVDTAPDDTVLSDRYFPGPELRPLRLLQIGCWFCVVILLRLTAGELFRYDRNRDHPRNDSILRCHVLPWLPSLLFALYRPAVVYTLSVMLELPLVAVLTAVVWLLTRIWVRRGLSGAGGAFLPTVAVVGLLLGTAGLLRGTSLVLAPVAVGAVWLAGVSRRRRGLAVAVLLTGVLLVLLPAVVHNSRLAGRLAGPTLNAGVNLYIGNGPEANGFYVAAVPGDWRTDPAGCAFLARRFEQPNVTLAEADRLWLGAALDAVAADPLRALGLFAKKIWLFLQVAEIDQLAPLAGWVEQADLLRVLCLPFALIVIPGVTGMLLAWSARPVVRVWSVLLIVLLLGQSLFFVVSRYRLALVPLLALLATVAVAEALRRRRRVWVVAALVAVAVQPWGLGHLRQMWPALAQANEARRWVIAAERSDTPEALSRAAALYERSLEGAPQNTSAWLGLAAIRRTTGDDAGAEHILRRGLAHLPDDQRLMQQLLAQLLQQARFSEALSLADALLEAHPDDLETRHNRVVLLMRANRTQDAEAAARRLLARAPDDPRSYLDLGVVLARTGRSEEAQGVFREGLRRHPEHPELLHNLHALSDR